MKNFMKGIFKPVDTKELDEKGQPKPDMNAEQLEKANANLAQAQIDEVMKEREMMAQNAIKQQELQAEEDKGKTPEELLKEIEQAIGPIGKK